MSKKIWKYELLTVAGSVYIAMPFGSKILTIQVQHNLPYLWAEVETSQQKNMDNRHFILVETGNEIPEYSVYNKYIGTVPLHDGSYVLHIYEVV